MVLCPLRCTPYCVLQDMLEDQFAAEHKEKVQLQREFDSFKDLTAQVRDDGRGQGIASGVTTQGLLT